MKDDQLASATDGFKQASINNCLLGAIAAFRHEKFDKP